MFFIFIPVLLIVFLFLLVIITYYIYSKKVQIVIFWVLGILVCLVLSNIVYTLYNFFAL